MKDVITRAGACTVCAKDLPHAPRPVFAAARDSRIVIIGQAPGRKVHESGVPWQDASGRLLRAWLDVSEEEFYDTGKFALLPMGFCFPGSGKPGDLPPRPECAPLWHPPMLAEMKDVRLTLLIGQYSQRHYLGDRAGTNLTETVRNFARFLPALLPLPHPSPRNRPWLARNEWFHSDLLPKLRTQVRSALR